MGVAQELSFAKKYHKSILFNFYYSDEKEQFEGLVKLWGENWKVLADEAFEIFYWVPGNYLTKASPNETNDPLMNFLHLVVERSSNPTEAQKKQQEIFKKIRFVS